MEKAVIVLTTPDEERQVEIAGLVETAGYLCVGLFKQLKRPRAHYFIGLGKVEEIKGFVEAQGVDLVVFEDYLTSRQVLSLEKVLKASVIDKFDLILNIFERHASSREAKLQIELARLKRKLPYVKLYAGERLREDHPGFGSSGAYIVHSTLGAMRERVRRLEDELESFERRVVLQGARRKEIGRVVAIVGYTNAGKTSLFNTLTGEGGKVKDEFFTTLRTKTASLDGGIFVNDTIGFIRNLPPELVHAFRATLREIKSSDLILLVLDASEPLEKMMRKKAVCEEVMVRIGADRIPTILVLNKVDLCQDIAPKAGAIGGGIQVSALTGVGVEELKRRIWAELSTR